MNQGDIPRAMLVEPVGSRVTCNPPPLDTDRDWLVLIDNWGLFHSEIIEAGWELGGSICYDESALPDDHKFSSYTKIIDGIKENLIVTASHTFYTRFLSASYLAKRFNLMDKLDRIALFQGVLYGNECRNREAA